MVVLRLFEDLSSALRRLRRRPHEMAAQVLLAAIGISAAGTLLGLIYGLFFRPLNFPDSTRLVAIYGVDRAQQSTPGAEGRWNRGPLPWVGWQALTSSPVLADTGVWARSRPVLGTPADDAIETWHVSSSLLRLLGATPVFGRGFTADEDTGPVSDAALISWECWQHRYGGRLDIVGTSVGVSYFTGEQISKTIVGVLAPGLRLRGARPELFLPIGERASWASNPHGSVYVIAKLAAGVPVDAAESSVHRAVKSTYSTDEIETRMVSLQEDLMGNDTASTTLLLVIGATILLIASASVGAMSLLEAEARRAEVTTRLTLGATPMRIAKSYAVEQFLKAALASAIGITVTVWLFGILTARLNAYLFELSGWNFVACGAVASVCMLLVMGTGPAAVLLQRRAAGGHETYWSSGARRTQAVTAVCQVSVLFVLLFCTGLVATSLTNLLSRPLGFDSSRLIVVGVRHTTTPRLLPMPGQIPAFSSWLHIEALLTSLRRLPGVTNAAGSSAIPFGSSGQSLRLRVVDSPGRDVDVQLVMVTEQYFQTMGIRLVAGRDLLAADRVAGPYATHISVVASEGIAKRTGWLGGRMAERNSPLVYETVGVASSIKQRRLTDDRDLSIYALSPTHDGITNIVTRVADEESSRKSAIGDLVKRFDGTMRVSGVSTVEQMLSESLGIERVRRDLFVACSVVATLLASLGVCLLGVRLVRERGRELGIRMALGATPFNIAVLIFRHQLKLWGVSMAIGIPAAVIASRLLSGLLTNAAPNVSGSIVGSLVVLAFVGVSAVLVPLRQVNRAGLNALMRE